jgi:hypothetical protein
MSKVFECQIALTSKQLLSDPRLDSWVGHTLELWLFEGVQARQALARQLEQRGIQARVRSAYKPLLHAFLEEIDVSKLASVVIEYPHHEAADPRRFLLEGYPLEAVLPGVEVSWVAAQSSTPTLPATTTTTTTTTSTSNAASIEQLVYLLTLTDHSGLVQTLSVLAPNELNIDLALEQRSLCPTGYLRASDSQSAQRVWAQRLETEFEQAFSTLMQWVTEQDWGVDEPYFERLLLRVELLGAEVVDRQGRLLSSTYEALHEDLYFSVLEFFQRRSKRPSGNRGLQPGQIVPDICIGSGAVRVRIEHFPVGAALLDLQAVEYHSEHHSEHQSEHRSEHRSEYQSEYQNTDVSAPVNSQTPKQAINHRCSLQSCFEPLSSDSVQATLNLFTGQRFEALSRQGRAVNGVYCRGTLPGIVLTGGQHANEASGVVGALRGAQWLAAQPQAHFAVVPLENPDGYALFQQYRAIHPQHMHHAARYTGLGDDLEYREQAPWYETEARKQAVALTHAQLHLSLHGYPAHEWTRPFTGYVPRGFTLWSLPKGFFLILRYQAAYKDLALQWLEALTESVSRLPGLAEFNRLQLQRYESYFGKGGFELKHGIACMISQNEKQNIGVKLVTEFPDETIIGEEFVFAQQVQTEAVRLACTHWWRLFRAPSLGAEV